MATPFLEFVRTEIRLRGYSPRTEKTYPTWIKRFIYFNNKRHPKECGPVEVKAFLSWLATDRHVAVNTQKVALNAFGEGVTVMGSGLTFDTPYSSIFGNFLWAVTARLTVA